MARIILEFEKKIYELEARINELRTSSRESGISMDGEIQSLNEKLNTLVKSTYSGLNRWQRVQLARHPDRPYTQDYIDRMVENWVELKGDRLFSNDDAIVSGTGILGEFGVVIIGHQKGRNVKENLKRNFGMPHPEGYRKALRLMKMAERFGKPVITIIDTIGAYPGLGAEERGQSEAIAKNLFEMATLKVPIINLVIGEGASGGALGIGVGDRMLMLENTWYSVISPEGCASILFKDAARAKDAAEAMKVTAKDLKEMGIADRIIEEPLGGAHRYYDKTAFILKKVLIEEIEKLKQIDIDELIAKRIDKLSSIGVYES